MFRVGSGGGCTDERRGDFNSRNDTELKFTNFTAMSFHVTVRSSRLNLTKTRNIVQFELNQPEICKSVEKCAKSQTITSKCVLNWNKL